MNKYIDKFNKMQLQTKLLLLFCLIITFPLWGILGILLIGTHLTYWTLIICVGLFASIIIYPSKFYQYVKGEITIMPSFIEILKNNTIGLDKGLQESNVQL